MEGDLALLITSLLAILPSAIPQRGGCESFRGEYCNMRLDNILLLESNVTSAAECQAMCFVRDACIEFSHFTVPELRCVLFSKCSSPINQCRGCVSGPAFPRISSCNLPQPLRETEVATFRSQPQAQPRCLVGCQPCLTCFGPGVQQPENNVEERGGNPEEPRAKEGREEEEITTADPYGEDGSFDMVGDEDEADNEEDDEVNVDDGLLDEVFNELPSNANRNGNNNSNRGNRRPNGGQNPNRSRPNGNSGGQQGCPTCPRFNTGFFYCVMGGMNSQGPVSGVTVMDVGTYRVPRAPLIAPFPTFMTRGNGHTFSSFAGRNLMTCTPGYQVSGITPASTFGGFLTQTYIPGTCNQYDFNSKQWSSTGGKMTTVRQGGSTVNIGSYLVTLGGVNPSGYPVTTMEIFNTKRADKGWQSVPQWSFQTATRDQCTVVTRDPVNGPELMVLGGQNREGSVMKMILRSGTWYSLPSMIYPRREHACTKVNMNGRPGVVISGGSDGFYNNMTSVEFYDIATGKWINLPNLNRGRRGHVMTTVEGQLAVAGGSSTGINGDTEFLNDVEVFDGRRWKRANYRMGEPRVGGNLVKIPFSQFGL